jgi:hypothetical protein
VAEKTKHLYNAYRLSCPKIQSYPRELRFMKLKVKLTPQQSRLLEQCTEKLLQQVDTVGYELRKRKVTDVVNRHNLVATLLTQTQYLQGEWERLELQLGQIKLKKTQTLQFLLEKTQNPKEEIELLIQHIKAHPLDIFLPAKLFGLSKLSKKSL